MNAESKQTVLRAVDRAIAHCRECIAAESPVQRMQLHEAHQSLLKLRAHVDEEQESYPDDGDFRKDMTSHDLAGLSEDARVSMVTEHAAQLTDPESIKRFSVAVRHFLHYSKGV